MQPVELLCDITAQRGKVAASAYSGNPAFSALVEQRFLDWAGVVQCLPCSECDQFHDAKIVCHNGQDGFFCPDIGFVPVTPNEIAAARPNVSKIINALANAFDCRARKSSPISGATWRVGRFSGDTGDIAVYFHPNLHCERDARDVSAALTSEPGSTYRLILTASGKIPVAKATVLTLSEVVEFDLCNGAFRPVADLRDLVGASRKNLGGAPNRYGDRLTEIILQRIADGIALAGRNEEARAVLTDFKRAYPNLEPPSLSSVQDYVSKVRAGQ